MTTSNAYSTGKIFDGYMGRNRVINGACNVNQRGSAVSYTTGVSGYSGPDRFNAANSGSAGGAFTQSSTTGSFGGVTRNFVTQQVTTPIASSTTTNYWGGITQNIEGYQVYDLVGGVISISFIFSTNVPGTFSIFLSDGSAGNSYVTTFTAVSGIQKITVPNIPMATNLSIPDSTSLGLVVGIGFLNTGSYQTSILNAWQSGIFRASSTNTNWGSTAGNFIAVSELQLEEGAICTPFERESYQVTLEKCWRYYYQATVPASSGQALFLLGFSNSATSCVFSFVFPVQMRVAPSTVLSSNLSTTSAATQNVGTSTSLIGVATQWSIGFAIGASGASYTTGQGAGLYIGNSSGSGGSFIVSAEL